MIIPLFPRTPTSSPEIHDPDDAPSIHRLDCASYNACLSDCHDPGDARARWERRREREHGAQVQRINRARRA